MPDPTQPDDESLRLELKEAIGAIQIQASLIVQTAGFFIAADTLLLAYGFSQRRSGIFLLASFMPPVMLAVYTFVTRDSVAAIYVAMVLEEKLNLRDIPLVGTLARARVRMKPILKVLDESDAKMADPGTRDLLMKRATRRYLLDDSAARLLCLATLLQIGFFLISLVLFHYPFA
jgi:hypothetical protein